jgi:hypothetical protein
MKYKISDIFSVLLPPLKHEEYKALKEDIEQNGVLHPLITWNGYIIDGHHRHQIAEELNIKIPEPPIKMDNELKDEDDVKVWIIDHQAARRNLSDIELADLYKVKWEILKKKGKQEMSEGGKKAGRGRPKKGMPKSGKPYSTREEMAKELGWKKTKTGDALYVLKYATDDEINMFKQERYTINAAYKHVKDRREDEHFEKQAELTEEEKYERDLNQILKDVETVNNNSMLLYNKVFDINTRMDDLGLIDIDPSLLTIDIVASFSQLFQAVSRMMLRFGIKLKEQEQLKN